MHRCVGTVLPARPLQARHCGDAKYPGGADSDAGLDDGLLPDAEQADLANVAIAVAHPDLVGVLWATVAGRGTGELEGRQSMEGSDWKEPLTNTLLSRARSHADEKDAAGPGNIESHPLRSESVGPPRSPLSTVRTPPSPKRNMVRRWTRRPGGEAANQLPGCNWEKTNEIRVFPTGEGVIPL